MSCEYAYRRVNKNVSFICIIFKSMCLSTYPVKERYSHLTPGPGSARGDRPWLLTFVSLFPWQEDEVVLQCIANVHKEQRKFCLAAEGLGNRLCFLEPTSEAKVRCIACPALSSSASQTVI